MFLAVTATAKRVALDAGRAKPCASVGKHGVVNMRVIRPHVLKRAMKLRLLAHSPSGLRATFFARCKKGMCMIRLFSLGCHAHRSMTAE